MNNHIYETKKIWLYVHYNFCLIFLIWKELGRFKANANHRWYRKHVQFIDHFVVELGITISTI